MLLCHLGLATLIELQKILLASKWMNELNYHLRKYNFISSMTWLIVWVCRQTDRMSYRLMTCDVLSNTYRSPCIEASWENSVHVVDCFSAIFKLSHDGGSKVRHSSLFTPDHTMFLVCNNICQLQREGHNKKKSLNCDGGQLNGQCSEWGLHHVTAFKLSLMSIIAQIRTNTWQ